MKSPSNRDWLILAVIAFIFLVIGWSAKGLFTGPKIDIPEVDTMKYVFAIDTLMKDREIYEIRIKQLEEVLDSLSEEKKVNRSNLNHNTNVIKKFNPTTRSRWNDSILRSEGVR